jgi:transposase
VPAGVIEIDIGAVRVRLRGAVDRSQRALRAAHAALDRMIGLPANTRVWLAAGHTDMRRGFDGLASMVQTALAANPFGGHLFVFRGRRGNIVKVLWFDGQGLCLFAKRLERGRFVWPQADTGAVSLTPAQMSMLLEGIDWRMPQRTWQPETLRPPQLAA